MIKNKLSIFILMIFFIFASLEAKSNSDFEKKNIYLIPGQGADERLYKNLKLDTSIFKIHHIKYEIPYKEEDLKAYALRLSKQIDATKEFYLIGVSLGGMIATEINEILKPKRVIIISSAKCRGELPGQYTFQKKIPVYKIVPKGVIKQASFIMQPLVEPDRKNEKETCVAMLKAKDPTFLKRTVGMIVNWDRTTYDPNIIHIHGNNDHTINIKKVDYTYLIENGSHMMMLTRADEITEIIMSVIE